MTFPCRPYLCISAAQWNFYSCVSWNFLQLLCSHIRAFLTSRCSFFFVLKGFLAVPKIIARLNSYNSLSYLRYISENLETSVNIMQPAKKVKVKSSWLLHHENDPKQTLKCTINYSHEHKLSIWNDLHTALPWISQKIKITNDRNHKVLVSLPKIS